MMPLIHDTNQRRDDKLRCFIKKEYLLDLPSECWFHEGKNFVQREDIFMTAVTHITFGRAERAACHFARLPPTFAARNKNNTQTYTNLTLMYINVLYGKGDTVICNNYLYLTFKT